MRILPTGRRSGAAVGPAPGPTLLTGVLMYSALCVSIMQTLGVPLIPRVAAETGVSLALAQWMLTGTLLVGVVAVPVLGRLGDGDHRRLVLLCALGGVFGGSMLGVVGNGLWAMLGGRALQGLGFGVVPLTIAIAREHLPAHKLTSAVAALSVTTATGAGLGFPIAGLVTDHFGIRAAFGMAALFSFGAFLAIALVVPGSTGRPTPRLDIPGGVLLGGGLLLILLALTQGEEWGWTSGGTGALVLGGLALLAVWVAVELRVTAPLVELRLLRHPSVANANISAVVVSIGMYASFTMFNRYLQTPPSAGYGFGATIAVTGLLLLPFSALSFLSSRFALRLQRAGGPYLALPLGAFVLAGANTLFALHRTSFWDMGVGMGLTGLGIGCTLSSMPGLIVMSVPPHETGSANSFNQVMRMTGGAMGGALAAAILAARTPAGQALPTDSGYTIAYLAGAGVALVASAIAVAMIPASRRHEAGRPTRLAATRVMAPGAADPRV